MFMWTLILYVNIKIILVILIEINMNIIIFTKYKNNSIFYKNNNTFLYFIF